MIRDEGQALAGDGVAAGRPGIEPGGEIPFGDAGEVSGLLEDFALAVSDGDELCQEVCGDVREDAAEAAIAISCFGKGCGALDCLGPEVGVAGGELAEEVEARPVIGFGIEDGAGFGEEVIGKAWKQRSEDGGAVAGAEALPEGSDEFSGYRARRRDTVRRCGRGERLA